MTDIKLRKIEINDDIKTLTELVYDTDPYIYKDLFGDKSNALNLFKILLNDKKSLFYRDHFYGAFIGDNIVGIMSVIASNYEWDADSMRLAYMELGIKMPDSAKAANEYLSQSFSRIGAKSVACNICVNADYRHMGIGDFLVKKIISIAGRNPIELCVIAENIPAVKLYENNGFKIIEEKLEYGGYGQEDVLCYAMVRMPS